MACLLGVWGPVSSRGAPEAPASLRSGLITRLADLAAIDLQEPRNLSIRLEGTVLWSSAAEGRIILQDQTATQQLELHLPGAMPQQGERLRLEGTCAVVQSRDAITLSSVPVVENNGLHAIVERSGTLYLDAGMHPIQMAWFNRTDFFGLEVEYEGPGVSKQPIQDTQLYRLAVDEVEAATNFVQGLDYRCFEGQWWRQLPNYDHMVPVASGSVTNFDVGARSRDSHAGLQFSGYLKVSNAGDYTFTVRSDDGSRLFIGPPSLSKEITGFRALPVPPAGWSYGSSLDEPEFQWLEIEGDVTAIYQTDLTLELEILTKDGLVRVKVAENTEGPLELKPQSRIQLSGVSRRIRNPEGNWVRGELFIQRLENQTSPTEEPVEVDPENLPLLTSIDQVFQLDQEESSLKYPVKVRGIITSPMEPNGAVLQDSSRGIYVALNGPVSLQVGDFCEIEGTTGPYRFSPYIEASSVKVLGAGSLPEPAVPSWDQLINGSLHCNYVELEGVVASVFPDWVTLLTREGRINIRLNPDGTKMPNHALGATVRLRGCLRADWDGISRRVVVGSIFLDQSWVTVVTPAPEDPFRVRYKRVDDLLQFDPEAGALQHVRVYGVLVHKGRDVSCVMDGRSGLRFIPSNNIDAEIGDMVDVAGFLELGGATPVLREAIARQTSHEGMPEPTALSPDDLLSDRHDATYVKIEGILLGTTEHADRVSLELQNGLRRFEAELEGTLDVDGLTPGSLLELEGVYLGQGGNRVLGRPIDSFRILLNSGAGIVVLSHPPWWTLQRMLSMVGILIVVLVAALVWIKLLRATVEQRTEELEDQIQERQHAEHERELEQERSRLANDLHDDLGARLTEVNMLASLVKSPFNTEEDRKKYANELSGIALHMVTSLDEIVWAVNPRNDTVSSLAGYFGAYAQRLLELASINCGLDVAESLRDLSLEPRFRRGVFLAFKEALTNVIQHAKASKVWLRIFVQGNDLIVMVSDDGSGFTVAERKIGADGLANMTERLKALDGSCTVESQPGKGTTVRLQAPIQRNVE